MRMKVREIIEFYSSVPVDNYKSRYPKTADLSEKGDDCADLADFFVGKGKGDALDNAVLNYLKERGVKDKFVFDKLTTAYVDVFNPFVDEEQKIVSQKWHLLISYYAYTQIDKELNGEKGKYGKGFDLDKEVTGGTTRWNIKGTGRSFSSKILKTWMAEAAGIDVFLNDIETITWEDVEKAIRLKQKI